MPTTPLYYRGKQVRFRRFLLLIYLLRLFVIFICNFVRWDGHRHDCHGKITGCFDSWTSRVTPRRVADFEGLGGQTQAQGDKSTRRYCRETKGWPFEEETLGFPLIT